MSTKSNKITFALIWLVGLLPLFLAIFMYYSGTLGPSNRVNQGELLQSQSLAQWQLTFENKAWKPGSQWQILHTLPTNCASKQCQIWQQDLPSVVKLLGKDSARVVIHQVGAANTMLQSEKIGQLGEAIWVADPLGNLVLRYSLNLEPKQLLKDLKKLLKISGIG
jgi:hypothetical protein